jgi:hypothetical protein
MWLFVNWSLGAGALCTATCLTMGTVGPALLLQVLGCLEALAAAPAVTRHQSVQLPHQC